jgi:anti-sigma factor RsiW
MNCQQVQQLIHAHTDGELDLVTTLQMDEHLGGCPGCEREYTNQQTLRVVIRDAAPYHRAPAKLRQQVSAGVRRTGPRRLITPAWWRRLAVAAALGLAFTGTMRFWMPTTRVDGDESAVQEILSGHIRSLMGQHLTDIASTNQHNVKPWFAGKLDFSPPVKDLTDRGFSLAGGRLDYLDNRPVAALVYHRRQHVINLFIWPSTAGVQSNERLITRQGYHVIRWTQDGMLCAAVSDINPAELGEFARVLQETPSSIPAR